MYKQIVGVVAVTMLISAGPAVAGESSIPLLKAKIDISNKASLQRGAKYYMNYCAGCHSLSYLRYSQMAEGLGLITYEHKLDKQLLFNNLVFTEANLGEPIKVSMLPADARQWFGQVPPDLSLVARVRGADWLYTYLKSFYEDKTKPFGANNWLFPDVAMPNVLAPLQGNQLAHYVTKEFQLAGEIRKEKVISQLIAVHDGQMSEHQFDSVVKDIVNFLVYVGEPVKQARQWLGYFVLGFLFLLLIIVYLIKKTYWRELR